MGETVVCYRHTERETEDRCTQCGNPACPECIRVLPLGRFCAACLAAARRGRGRPTAPVAGLIAVNGAVFALAVANPDLTTRFGADTEAIRAGEYYRLLTFAFVPVNLANLFVTVAVLAVAGPLLEEVSGRARLLAVYLLAALGGVVGSTTFGSPGGVGMPGTAFGVLGALMAIGGGAVVDSRAAISSIVVGLLTGAVIRDIDGAANIGGLTAGILVGTAFASAKWPAYRQWRDGAAAVGAAALLAFMVFLDTDEPADIHERVLELQREQFEAIGPQGAEAMLRQPPGVIPPYQAVNDGRAEYNVYVAQDPDRSRKLRLSYGDGSSKTITIPRGDGYRRVVVTHTYPRRLARYNVEAVLAGGDGYSLEIITDVCPRGVTPPPPATDDEVPMCGG